MKSNESHQWKIELVGKNRVRTVQFTGTLDQALGEADEQESEVKFVVVKFTVTRGKRVYDARAND